MEASALTKSFCINEIEFITQDCSDANSPLTITTHSCIFVFSCRNDKTLNFVRKLKESILKLRYFYPSS